MVKSDQMARHEKERELATQSEDAAASPATDVATRKRAAIDIDDEGNQNKKQVAASKKKAPPKKRAAKNRTRCRIGPCTKFPQPGCQKMCLRCFRDTTGETAQEVEKNAPKKKRGRPKGNQAAPTELVPLKKKKHRSQKLSTPVDATTDIFTRYSRVENHYNVALCSISKSLSLLTNLNVEQNKMQKLSDSVVTTATDDKVSILSTEEEAKMQEIRRIARGGYFEGLMALKFGRERHAVVRSTLENSTFMIHICQFLDNESLMNVSTVSKKLRTIIQEEDDDDLLRSLTCQLYPERFLFSTSLVQTTNALLDNAAHDDVEDNDSLVVMESFSESSTKDGNDEDKEDDDVASAAVEITPDVIDLPTLAILKNNMSKLRYPNKKPKEGGWADSTAAENIDNWPIITRSEEIDDLSVHQLMIFLQAHSCNQLDLHKSFLQKCNLNQFFEDIAPEKIKSDLNTIKNCLKLIQDAKSDITKIAKQIAILEDVSIVQSMIKVKKEKAKSQWEVDSILTTAAAPIQELMKKPPVEAARKFVEVDLLMTCSIGDTQSKSLEDIKSLNVASYPVPGKNHKQVYHNLGWMKMDCNKTMWILPNAAVCAEQFNALPKGSTKNYLACTLFVEMLPMVLDSHFAKKTGGYPFIFQALCKAFDMNVGEEYWKVINESLPNLNRNCIQLLGKHLLSSPFFPYQAGDKVLRNKHPETSFYAVKEDDCNIEMVHRQCLHVAHTLDQPYHRPTDIELLGIAQVVGMVPAADNSFKFQTTSKGGRKTVAEKLGIYDPKHKDKGSRAGGRARNVLLGHTQWNGDQIKVLLEYVITNCGSGQRGEINWSSWDSDGVEGYEKLSGQNKLYDLIRQYKRKNKGDDGKTNNDANTKQLYQIVLAEQLENNLFI